MRRLLITLAVVGAAVAVLPLPLPWPESLAGGHLVNAVAIAAPPERVFAYIATPSNWPRWHPASRAVRGVVDRTPAIGESVIETFEVAGRGGDATWITRELILRDGGHSTRQRAAAARGSRTRSRPSRPERASSATCTTSDQICCSQSPTR